MRTLAPQLEQVCRTYVRYRGRKLSYFGGCDYFRLATHPVILRAAREGLSRYGLNVAASRLTTGNHPVYELLERALARFFGVESAVIVSCGYVTNFVVAQALTGHFSHVLIDQHAHSGQVDAAQFFECPVLRFKHRDADDLARALARCGKGARPILLTDGMFTHDGSVAPLEAYLEILPRDATILVDDAHGAGTLGDTGKGAVEVAGVGHRRIIQTVTLSKAFGVYGGAILGTNALRDTIAGRSRLFVGNTPLALPLAGAALRAIELLKKDGRRLRERLAHNTNHVRTALREAGQHPAETPGPIIALNPRNNGEVTRLRRRLLAAGIYPPVVRYLGAPKDSYFRFAISSEHTRQQLDALAKVLIDFSQR
jgi:7-keto-8-aminopelargonate synthetase-like enzyme